MIQLMMEESREGGSPKLIDAGLRLLGDLLKPR
jgi:hypothetical protein